MHASIFALSELENTGHNSKSFITKNKNRDGLKNIYIKNQLVNCLLLRLVFIKLKCFIHQRSRHPDRLASSQLLLSVCMSSEYACGRVLTIDDLISMKLLKI